MKEKILFFVIAVGAILGMAAPEAKAECDTGKLAAVNAYQKGDLVKNLQECLIKSGFNIGAGATGYYGGQTISAVKAFYASWYGMWSGLKFGPAGINNLKNGTKVTITGGTENFKNFASVTDFKNYLKKVSQEQDHTYYSGGMGMEGRTAAPTAAALSDSVNSASKTAESQTAVDRASETNVQVAGIDEPDIVKTDGKQIYYSPTTPITWWERGGGIALMTDKMMPSYYKEPEAKVIKALPVKDLAVAGNVKKSGDLLLSGNILAVFSNLGITGFDVTNASSPAEKWNIKQESDTSILGSRFYNGKIYVVTRTSVNDISTCPIRPLSVKGAKISVPCNEIYYPERVLPVDSTFTVFVINPATGDVEKKTSFLGAAYTSIVYMSGTSMYVTYQADASQFDIAARLAKEAMKDLLTSEVIEKITKLESYDISSNSKLTELNTILQNFRNTLDADARLKYDNETNNRRSSFVKSHKREFDKTVVVKINLSDLALAGSGSIPGQPLNQFSLDEYNGNLRIATTVGGSWQTGGGDSASDVYVLDGQMKITGSVLDLGKTEKIYSARFIEDKGYVVTFRQTDPFYVINLADPKNPKLAGELKIPGYSSYLHPVTKDKILGIGKEGSNVKISYFDVADPANPKEMDKYTLDEYWTDVINTHHAFLMDKKYDVFFMPGNNGGYVFSYKNDKLSLVKAVGDVNAKRAVYVNDFLYILSDNKISVLNETNWEKVKELEF